MCPFRCELAITGKLNILPAVIEFVEKGCEQAGIDCEACFDVILAVEEATANVIEHAYDGKGGSLYVRLETCGEDLTVTLHDHGQPFDPCAIRAPDTDAPLAKRPIGGLGLHLMYQLMDEVHFAFENDGNTLVMVKRKAARKPLDCACPGAPDG